MRKIFIFLILLLAGIIAAALLIWSNKTSLAAHFLSKHLRVPVSIETLEITKTEALIQRLWIGNPPESKTNSAFKAETIEIDARLKEVMGDPLIIDEIHLANIYVGIEFYNKTDTNWAHILESTAPAKTGKQRGYLIRRLILDNLTVEVTQADGSVKRYPTIPHMEFQNISDETGFPVEEIEKAIFNLIMKDLIKKLNLDQIFQNIPGGSPLKYVPNLFK